MLWLRWLVIRCYIFFVMLQLDKADKGIVWLWWKFKTVSPATSFVVLNNATKELCDVT